jgi:hypothetical protein
MATATLSGRVLPAHDGVIDRHRAPSCCFGRWQLAGCSFVMSSAHGAGLMLVPAFVIPVLEHVSALDLYRVSRMD